MKKYVQPFEYARQICEAMKTGILLTTKIDDRVNTMTIGWGSVGIEWNRPIFIAYVRESRHTRIALDQTGEFTVNIPINGVDPKLLRYCGTVSGRDTDKISDMQLTLEEPDKITVPGIRELPLTLECKVLFQQPQNPELLPQEIRQRFYPVQTPDSNPDYHIAYYGEIVSSYIISDD